MEPGEQTSDRGGSGALIRVGPAGWSYPDSPGKVYPAGAPRSFDALDYLSHYFDTIEINATFYAPQPARSFQSWVRRVKHNPRFKFTAKLWQRFTHGVKEYGRTDAPTHRRTGEAGIEPWSADDVRLVTDGMQLLRDEGLLGAVLAQFPWSFKRSRVNRQLLTRLSEDFAGWPVVVELRHGSWARHEDAVLLRELGLGFCNIDQPVIGDALKPTAGVTSAVGYVRLHGRNYERWIEHEGVAQRYDYLYSADELAPWVERIRKVASADGVEDVYVVTNNHYEGKGPANALMIRAMLEGRKVPAPPVLFNSYRRSLMEFAEPVAEAGNPTPASGIP